MTGCCAIRAARPDSECVSRDDGRDGAVRRRGNCAAPCSLRELATSCAGLAMTAEPFGSGGDAHLRRYVQPPSVTEIACPAAKFDDTVRTTVYHSTDRVYKISAYRWNVVGLVCIRRSVEIDPWCPPYTRTDGRRPTSGTRTPLCPLRSSYCTKSGCP